MDANSFGYDEVEYTVTNTYRKHKYTNVKELVSTKYYYYTGNSQNATIGGLNMSLIRNSVITCEYNYFSYSSGYYEYTETRKETRDGRKASIIRARHPAGRGENGVNTRFLQKEAS